MSMPIPTISKSFESRKSKVESRTSKPLDLDELLKVDDTSNSASNKKTAQSRREYHKAWAEDKAQISIRVSQELKAQIDAHTAERGEKLAAFVVRAIKEQIKRDNEQ